MRPEREEERREGEGGRGRLIAQRAGGDGGVWMVGSCGKREWGERMGVDGERMAGGRVAGRENGWRRMRENGC